MFSLICAWINDWVNNGEADDLRRHRAHNDVTVMNCFLVFAGTDTEIYSRTAECHEWYYDAKWEYIPVSTEAN